MNTENPQFTYATPNSREERVEHELRVTEPQAGAIVGLRDLKGRRLRNDPDRPAHLRYGRAIRYLPSELVRWRNRHVVHPTA